MSQQNSAEHDAEQIQKRRNVQFELEPSPFKVAPNFMQSPDNLAANLHES